ncbi:MAG: endonuclease/exonuclease/phosphatase family protein [Solirubrobacterales bacterium]|nr:endonuclease/exonuclease/phosphatase family protein [Solirubrobacterales bacterium]
MRILTWNLFHGRSLPNAGRDLLPEFQALIGSWDWDVALLQEVPPWWPAQLPGTDHDTVLTSRNALLPLRRALAVRWPDLMKSDGGSSNAILVRDGRIEARARRRLRLRPERRVVHAVRVDGLWIANMHAQVHTEDGAQADIALAVATLERWAGTGGAGALILGGDLNVVKPIAPGFTRAGGHGVDHVLVRGLQATRVEHPGRGTLSDHAPVIVTVGDSRA